MTTVEYMRIMGRHAKAASVLMAQASTQAKNTALYAMAEALHQRRMALLQANEHDIQKATASDLAPALLERLELTEAGIAAMSEGLAQVAALVDPVGQITELHYRPSGIQVGKMRVPLGVIGIIYESRPNVTLDAASLCLKSGNAAILRGGSEASASNQAIADCISVGLQQANLPTSAVQVVNTTDRAAVGELITMTEHVDVIVPRGGKGLIERISREARIPVIKHLDGNCHVYLDDEADPVKAINIAINAKTRRYGVCNAMETLLVASACADRLLPVLAQHLQEFDIELRLCERAMLLLPETLGQRRQMAVESDWFTEYLAPVLAIKVVDNISAAIDHINHYGSHHTDAIVTENYSTAQAFLTQVDSSSVIVNASTGFADGFEYGLGAEIGISTDKIHARGPVGLQGLTSQKYIVLGNGQVRH